MVNQQICQLSGFFLNNGLTHATLLQHSGENIHSLPKDSAVVAVDLIDSIQPVCNFLEQRQRNQHLGTDQSRQFWIKSKISKPEHYSCLMLYSVYVCVKTYRPYS